MLNNMEEQWKDIFGFEGLYQVSNFGRVKSFKGCRGVQERILKPRKVANGYLQIALCKDGKHNWRLIHRLVAEAFLPNPNNLSDVNHKDENPQNSNLENLEWVDHKTNINYGTGIERRAKTRLKTVFQYRLDGTFVKEWPSLKEVQRQLGFNHGNISSCCNGRNKTSYGFRWKYKKK